MKPIRALIVDDEPRARARLRRLLGVHADVEVAGEGRTGDEALSLALSLRPEVIFLDIRMPGSDGVSAAQRLRDNLPEGLRPLVVFTTAYDDRAVDAFALEATDYLVKPIERERLAEALRRVRRVVWSRQPTSAPPAPRAENLEGHRGGRVFAVSIEDLAAVVVEDTVCFGLREEGRVRLSGSLAELESKLGSAGFLRVSRSALVATAWVEALEPGGSGTYTAVLKAPVGGEVAVSRRRARRIREALSPKSGGRPAGSGRGL